MTSALRLVRQSVHTSIWSSIGIVIAAVSGIITARMLGPTDRGTLAIALTVVGLEAVICSLGTSVSLRIYLPRDPRVTIGVFLALSSKLALLSAALMLPLMLLLSRLVDHRLASPPVLFSVILLTVSVFLSNQLLDCFNAMHYSSRSAQLNTIGIFIAAVLLLVCWTARLGLVGALLAYGAAFGVRVAIGWMLLARTGLRESRPTTSGGDRLLLRQGIPLLGMNVGQSIVLRVDLLLVGVILGSKAAGLYAVAATPASILIVVSTAVGQVTFAEAAHQSLSGRLLVRQLTLAVLATAGGAMVGILLVPWIVPLLFGAEFVQSVPVAQLLLVAQLTCAPYLVLTRAAAGYALVKWSAFSGLLGAGLMIASAFFLIPRLGLMGAVWSGALTFAGITALLAAIFAAQHPWTSAIERDHDGSR